MIEEKKICFISCVNNKLQYEECLKYINSLSVPEGFCVETIQINNAKSMAAGYNEAMKKSNAKYKVYLHQDLFIINKNFIYDIVNTFNSSNKIGMIGCIGAKRFPESAVWWEAKLKSGKMYNSYKGKMEFTEFGSCQDQTELVWAIDGAIMITQDDLGWREDLFDGWHFYDISQSVEFKLKGLEIAIPKQIEPWCIHDSGTVSIEELNKYRKVFLKEYWCKIFNIIQN